MEERRKHARPETTARYRRLRREIDPPPALAHAGNQLFAGVEQAARGVSNWARRSRKLAVPNPGGSKPG